MQLSGKGSDVKLQPFSAATFVQLSHSFWSQWRQKVPSSPNIKDLYLDQRLLLLVREVQTERWAACVAESGDARASTLQVVWPDLHSQAAPLPHSLIQGSTGSFSPRGIQPGKLWSWAHSRDWGVPCEKWDQGTFYILRTTSPVSPLLGSGAVETK